MNLSSTTALMKTCTGECGETFPATAEYFHRKKASKDGLRSRCIECKAAKDHQYREANREQIAEQKRQYREVNREKVAEQKRQYYVANREKVAEYSRQYREDNQGKTAERHRQYREANPERNRQYYIANREKAVEYARQYREANREWYAEYNRQYREANQEQIAEQSRQYRDANREKRAEYNRQYQQANPEKFRVYNQRRKARKRGLPDTFTTEQWVQCLDYFNYCCPVCDNQLRDLFRNIEPHQDHWIPVTYDGDDNPGTVAQNMICLCNNCNLSKGATMPDEWLKQKFGTRKAKQISARIEAYFEWCEDAA